MAANVEGYAGPLTVRQFKGGQSNPTYELTTPGAAYVLRRKPPGVLLPSAHAVDREFTVISALSQAGLSGRQALCSVHGRCGHRLDVLRHGQGRGPGPVGPETARDGAGRTPRHLSRPRPMRWPPCTPSIPPRSAWPTTASRATISSARSGAGPNSIEASEIDPIPAMDRLIAFLPATLPAEGPTRHRPRRLPPRQSDHGAGARPRCGPCWTGSCRRWAIRWRTFPIC